MTTTTHSTAAGAVEALLKPHTTTVEYLPGRRYTVHAPCLLRQLHDAIANGTNSAPRRGNTRSRTPLDTAALDLWREIEHDTHYWARELGIDRRPYLTLPAWQPKPATPPRNGRYADYTRRISAQPPRLGLLLRAVATRAEDDLAAAVEHLARTWTRRIDTMLGAARNTVPIRGATCWHCGTNTDHGWQPTEWIIEEQGGEHYRQPAIVAVFNPTTRQLWHFECRACRSTKWPDRTLLEEAS